MHLNPVSAPSGVRSSSPARKPLIERRLARYCMRLQPRVRALASRHARLADLAASYPALLFALAVPRQGFDPSPAIERVVAGDTLSKLSAMAGLPMWLRALPPEAFTRALRPLPDGPFVSRHIANHIPKSPKKLPAWLDAVGEANAVGDERIAVWIASEMNRDAKSVKADRIRRVSLWAWFSGQPATRAHAFIEKPWQAMMKFATADDSASVWRQNFDLLLNLGDAAIDDVWLEPGTIEGYQFVPLRTAEDILAEAAAMENCLATYGWQLAHDRCRLWSVRNAGGRVATLEVAQLGNVAILAVVQLRGPRNSDVEEPVVEAALRWTRQCRCSQRPPLAKEWNTAPLDLSVWQSLWRPYWLAKRHIPAWLPLRPTRAALQILD
jgi:hypothetical protein